MTVTETPRPTAVRAPRCGDCRRRHNADLPCWRGAYARDVTREVLATQGNVCWMCGGKATTADHLEARARGGNDGMENLRPACRPCNSRKGTDGNPFEPEAETRPTGVGLSGRWRTAADTPQAGGAS